MPKKQSRNSPSNRQAPQEWLLHTQTATLPFSTFLQLSKPTTGHPHPTDNAPFVCLGPDMFSILSSFHHESPHTRQPYLPLPNATDRTHLLQLATSAFSIDSSLAALYHSTEIGSSSAPDNEWFNQTSLFHGLPSLDALEPEILDEFIGRHFSAETLFTTLFASLLKNLQLSRTLGPSHTPTSLSLAISPFSPPLLSETLSWAAPFELNSQLVCFATYAFPHLPHLPPSPTLAIEACWYYAWTLAYQAYFPLNQSEAFTGAILCLTKKPRNPLLPLLAQQSFEYANSLSSEINPPFSSIFQQNKLHSEIDRLKTHLSP